MFSHRFLLYIMLPLGLIFCTIVFWLIIKCIIRIFKESYYKNGIICLWVNLYVIYPVIIKESFKVVDCVTLNDKVYLRTDLTFECWTEDHVSIILKYGIPFIFIILSFPAMIFLFLQSNRDSLND